MSYDGRGLLVSSLDANLNETVFTYTPGRRLQTITNALGEVTTYTYWPDGLLKTITDADGQTVSFEYSDVGQLLLVSYPEVEVVLPTLQRALLTPRLRMAYDVWDRLVAVTSPNGNQDNVDHINVVGALNLVHNGGAEVESGVLNDSPLGWEWMPLGTAGASSATFYAKARSSAESLEGEHSFPLVNVGSDGQEWVQRRPSGSPGGGPGGRYLMEGWAKADASGTFQLRALVRELKGGLSMQSGSTAVEADSWTGLKVLTEMPGDAQVSRTKPAFFHFRAGLSGGAFMDGSLDKLQAHSLSQLLHYDGENMDGSTGPDGAQVKLVRDRFGRTRQLVDPSGRTVDFVFDALDWSGITSPDT